MKKLFSLFTFHFLLSTLFAQDRHTIDSLQNDLKQFEAQKREMGKNATVLADSIKANLLYAIGIEYWGVNPDTAGYYANQTLSISQQIGYKKGIGNAYNLMGLVNLHLKNFTLASDYFENAIKLRTGIGDKKGLAGTYINLSFVHDYEGEMEMAIKDLFESIKVREEIGDKFGLAETYGRMAIDYEALGKFPEAVTSLLNKLKIAEETGNRHQASGAYTGMGGVYYSEGNYAEALKNYRISLEILTELGDSSLAWQTNYNIGRVYYKQGNDTGALKYMLASLEFVNKNHYWIGYVEERYYNVGLVYLDMGNYKEALRNTDSAMKECRIMSSQINMAKVYIEFGSICEKLGKYKQALDSATKGLALAKQVNGRIVMQDAYSLLARINMALHNYEAAAGDYKEYNSIHDSSSGNEVQQKISVLELNYAFDRREDSLKAEQEKSNIIKADESKRKSLIAFGAIVIALLSALMAVLLISRQRLKHKKDKLYIESELAKAKITLDDYIKNIVEKNELLEQFQVEVENLKSLKSRELDENRVEKLEHLNRKTILTEDDWNKFKELFEHVHQGFFIRLKEKLPDLTPAEIRLFCLTKLNLDTKQMGGMLGVSIESVRTSRYRLRKKLNLPEETGIETIVNTI